MERERDRDYEEQMRLMHKDPPWVLEDELFEFAERDYDIQQIYATVPIPGEADMDPVQLINEINIRGMIARGLPLTHVPTWMIPADVMPPDRDPNAEWVDPTILGWIS